MSRNALKDDGRLSKMRQEEPEMLEALEENLADFHGRKEKSSTWWCPRLKGSHPERKKETFNFLNLLPIAVSCFSQVTSHPPVTLYVGDIPPGLNEQGLRHTFQSFGDLLSVNIVR